MIAAVNEFRWVQRVILVRESEIVFFLWGDFLSFRVKAKRMGRLW